MKNSLLKVVLATLAVTLAGCISVHERTPDTVSTTTTTRHTSAVVPASTTVERTTVY